VQSVANIAWNVSTIYAVLDLTISSVCGDHRQLQTAKIISYVTRITLVLYFLRVTLKWIQNILY